MERLYRRAVMALRSLLRRRRVDAELDEELRFHAEQMYGAEISRGAAPSDARLRTLRHMGSVDSVKDACRDTRTLMPVEHLLQDVRFGVRLLGRSPGFAGTAVLSLALGIGASSSIFSVINAVVLRPLPVVDPHDLYIAHVVEPEEVDELFSSAVVERAARLLDGRAEIAAQSSTESVLIAAPDDAHSAEPARLQLVAGDYFRTLRQRAQIGRLLGPDDNRAVGQHPVAVISDGYWSRRFGRNRQVLETGLLINGAHMAVVGVAAPEFFGATLESQTPDVWAPAAMQATLRFAGNYERTGGDLQKPWVSQPEFSWLRVVVRAPNGAAPAAAEALTLAEQQGRSPEGAQTSRTIPVNLVPAPGGFSSIRSQLSTPLIVLLLMVGLLLALACANIASLLLARAMSRSREMAIRVSLGAGRGRLIRQLLTESLILAAAGGVLGLVLADWGSGALLTFLNGGGQATGIDAAPDWRVAGMTFATSTATALAFGLLPALRGTRVALAESLKAQTRGVIGSSGRAGRVPVGKVLVASQMAFATLLLLVAALFGRSLQALTRVDVGYDREHLLVVRIDARASGYDVTELPALAVGVVDRLSQLPGVVAVSMSAHGPFSGNRSRGDFEIEGYVPSENELVMKHSDWVTPDYFRAVGLRITRGRGFTAEDSARSRRVSVINETMAQRYFPGENPLGKRWGDNRNFAVDGIEIIGVVEDARYNDVKAESVSMSYLPAAQSGRYPRSIEVRTSGDSAAMAAALRRALRESQPRLAIGSIESLDERIVRSIRVERLLGWLTMTFGGAALALACLGLYGTISNAVRRRRAELGIRVALGADRAAVQWLIVREALVLVLLGGAIGLPLAFISARALRSLLFGIAPSDPLAYASAAGVLLVVCVFAAYVPAWRASRLDPIVALRSE